MENFELILSFAGVVLSLLFTCLIFIIKLFKSFRDKKKILNNLILEDAVAPIMEIAEEFKHFNGKEKKEYVITKINQLALESGLDFNPESINAKIEELIKLSKSINTNK